MPRLQMGEAVAAFRQLQRGQQSPRLPCGRRLCEAESEPLRVASSIGSRAVRPIGKELAKNHAVMQPSGPDEELQFDREFVRLALICFALFD